MSRLQSGSGLSDRVFGPTTTTRHVYDIAAHHVVGGAMEGVNGTIFAYGATSSGKTHTMHGNQRSPGIIPLAVKDIFSIIQKTPSSEFLLRVSYLEIYNEVVNDSLNPAGQNLRIKRNYPLSWRPTRTPRATTVDQQAPLKTDVKTTPPISDKKNPVLHNRS